MHENEDEWSALRSATTALHEMFVTLMKSGFSEDQACKILGVVIANAGDAMYRD